MLHYTAGGYTCTKHLCYFFFNLKTFMLNKYLPLVMVVGNYTQISEKLPLVSRFKLITYVCIDNVFVLFVSVSFYSY